MGSAKSHVIARSAHSPLSFRERETCTRASLSRIPHLFRTVWWSGVDSNSRCRLFSAKPQFSLFSLLRGDR
jgi:hypothetical protein